MEAGLRAAAHISHHCSANSSVTPEWDFYRPNLQLTNLFKTICRISHIYNITIGHWFLITKFLIISFFISLEMNLMKSLLDFWQGVLSSDGWYVQLLFPKHVLLASLLYEYFTTNLSFYIFMSYPLLLIKDFHDTLKGTKQMKQCSVQKRKLHKYLLVLWFFPYGCWKMHLNIIPLC